MSDNPSVIWTAVVHLVQAMWSWAQANPTYMTILSMVVAAVVLVLLKDDMDDYMSEDVDDRDGY